MAWVPPVNYHCTLAFLGGALASGFIGFLGMWLATRANVRTASAAKSGTLSSAARHIVVVVFMKRLVGC